jgi:hypothetical protein
MDHRPLVAHRENNVLTPISALLAAFANNPLLISAIDRLALCALRLYAPIVAGECT